MSAFGSFAVAAALLLASPACSGSRGGGSAAAPEPVAAADPPPAAPPVTEAPAPPVDEPVSPPPEPPPAPEPPPPPAPAGESPPPGWWANSFHAYPGTSQLCWSEMDHGSSRSYVEVHGSGDATAKVLAFYAKWHAKDGKDGRYLVSKAGSRALLSVYTLADAQKRKPCRGGKPLSGKTVVVVESEVQGEPEPLDF
jgi:hypothetical protein